MPTLMHIVCRNSKQHSSTQLPCDSFSVQNTNLTICTYRSTEIP